MWVAVDRLSEMRHYIPCHTMMDVSEQAEVIVKQLVCIHGLLITIMSDLGPQFTVTFWGRICSRLGM